MSIEAREERKEHRKGNKKLELWQQNEVAGMVFFGNLWDKNVDTQTVISYIWKRFEVQVSPDWVSDWMVAMHLSSLSPSRLLSVWNLKAAEKYEKYHRKQLEQYLWRRRMVGKKISALPGRIGPWWDTIRKFEFMD